MFEYRLPLGRASAAGIQNVMTAAGRAAEFEGASTPVYGGQANG